jgi:HK97 family phage major capsid protein
VLEGGTKPESALTFEQAQDAIRKIAHWLPVSEEMLEDVAQIRSYIDARLRLGVQLKEEDQLLYGTGTAPELAGLLTRAGLAADVAVGVAPDTAMDAILRQMMAIYSTSFLQPDGVIVNPADWAEIILTKGGDGNYLTSGPFAPVQSATLWGLPVVVTPSVTAGTAVVGAFKSGGQVWRKGGITVEATNAHADFFIKNLVAIRAEERLALAIYRPGAFGKVTGV